MSAPPFPYFGGKGLLAPRIADLLPEHGHYVEPFGGSLAVLLAKRPAPMETVNDLDQRLMKFWRVLRERPEELARAVALTPHSRAEYELVSEPDPEGCDDVEIARRVHVKLTQGRGAVGVRSGWRHYVAPAGGTGMPDYLLGYLQRLAPVAERLQQVSLECRPALDVIATYGRSPEVLLYLDPPYVGSARGNQGGDARDLCRSRTGARYTHEMLGETDHRELAAALLDCSAAVVLSGYPSPLYDELYEGWHRVEFTTGTGQSARGEWSTRTEVLWSNRPLGDQPSLFDEVAS